MMRKRILVVEDDQAIVALLEDVLAEEYEVDEAWDCFSALDHLEHEAYDLLVVDVGLPGRDGAELVQEATARGLHRLKPILMISAYDRLLERVKRLPIQGTLRKPFRLADLERKVCTLLNSCNEKRGGLTA